MALIASAGAALLVTALFQTGGFQIAGFEVNVLAVIMLIIALFALRKYKVDAMLVIFICGVSAILLSFLGIM